MSKNEKRTILLIDDEENLRQTLALILRREGYDVTMASTVKEARQCVENTNFDLTFLDLKLPDANGMTLLPDLKRRYPNMPVLILTAHDKLESAIEAVRKGARDYLLKPIDPPLIIKRVKEVLDEGDQPRSVREGYTQLKSVLENLRPDGKANLPKGDKPAE